MIAAAPKLDTQPKLTIVPREQEPEAEAATELAMAQVVGTLQLLLAARRQERAARK